MDLSKAIEMIKEFEGCVLHSYLDSVNVPTIGYGHTLGVHPGQVCTQNQADQWLQEDLNKVVVGMTSLIRVPINDNQYCALADFCFNLGVGSLRYSHLLTYLNAGYDPQAIAGQLLLWNHAGGQVLAGLTRRRAAEYSLFLRPLGA